MSDEKEPVSVYGLLDAIPPTLGRDAMRLAAGIWDQGYVAGHARALRYMTTEPDVEHGVNPYQTQLELLAARHDHG